MNRKLFLLCLVGLMMSASANADCEGGTVIGSYCRSNKLMNWWSAYNWCKSNSMRMPTIYDICPSWDGNKGYKCSEMAFGTGQLYGWTTTAEGEDSAYIINFDAGQVSSPNSDNYRSRTERAHALCK